MNYFNQYDNGNWLGDSLQGLRRQAKAYVTLIHLHALSLLLQPPASLYCPIFSVTLTTPYCKVPGSLMIYLHQGMLEMPETDAQADGLMHCSPAKL